MRREFAAQSDALSGSMCGFSGAHPRIPPEGKDHPGREDERVMPSNLTRGMTKIPQPVAVVRRTGEVRRTGNFGDGPGSG